MISEELIIKEYCENNLSIYKISKKYNTSSKIISKVIDNNRIPKKKKNNNIGRKLSIQTKNKISDSIKNLSVHPSGWKHTFASNLNNIKAQFKLPKDSDLSKYSDYDKLKKITYFLSKNIKKETKTPEYILNFIDYFYNDHQFNKIYDEWKISKNKWNQPSLDHKTPITRGGSDEISNLQVLTWFENRCKIDLTQEEWNNFKKKTGTISNLFYEY